uniref:Uncharacterized protein n=1 Tax=Avena sativa TaxID=4498 RepID=A0ACD6AUI0_AVESA
MKRFAATVSTPHREHRPRTPDAREQQQHLVGGLPLWLSSTALKIFCSAKPYCQIFYICKETLACSRQATHLSVETESPRSSAASSVSDQPEFPPRSLSLPPGHPGLSSTDHQPLQRRSNSVSYPSSGTIADSVENMPAARRRSIDITPNGFSPNSSQQSTDGSSSGLKDLDSMDGSPVPVSVASSEEHQHSMVSHIGLRRVL